MALMIKRDKLDEYRRSFFVPSEPAADDTTESDKQAPADTPAPAN